MFRVWVYLWVAQCDLCRASTSLPADDDCGRDYSQPDDNSWHGTSQNKRTETQRQRGSPTFLRSTVDRVSIVVISAQVEVAAGSPDSPRRRVI